MREEGDNIEGVIVRTYWSKAKLKPNMAHSNPDLNGSLDFLFLPALLIVTHFSLLGCFYTSYASILGRYHITLESPTSWGPQHNTRIIFIASHNGTSKSPCRDSSTKFLASVVFLSHGEDSGGPLLQYSWLWSHNYVTKLKFFCLLRLKPSLLQKFHFPKLCLSCRWHSHQFLISETVSRMSFAFARVGSLAAMLSRSDSIALFIPFWIKSSFKHYFFKERN